MIKIYGNYTNFTEVEHKRCSLYSYLPINNDFEYFNVKYFYNSTNKWSLTSDLDGFCIPGWQWSWGCGSPSSASGCGAWIQSPHHQSEHESPEYLWPLETLMLGQNCWMLQFHWNQLGSYCHGILSLTEPEPLYDFCITEPGFNVFFWGEYKV